VSTGTDGGRWLIRTPDPAARARLLCLPVSGIGATLFRHWPAQIGDVEVCPVQLPGRENRMKEKAYTSMEEFAADATEALGPFLDKPYALFGHCLGARLGYALAKELAARGTALPRQLFVSSCLAPHRGGRFGGGRNGPFTPETTDEEYFSELRHGCQIRGEPEPPQELLSLSVRVMRADIALTCDYVPDGPDGAQFDITTIGWTNDPHVLPEDMDEWAAYGKVRHVVLPGGEYTYRSAPEDLLQVISDVFRE
jgi:surfactin synthase thioesterase subunit